MSAHWKEGDWAIHDMEIVQITRIREDLITVTTGVIDSTGVLADRLRPLTIPNKRTAESIRDWYNYLRRIDGNDGFNYPDINRYFCRLALQAMDGEGAADAYTKARTFVEMARCYAPEIDGVRLFRRAA